MSRIYSGTGVTSISANIKDRLCKLSIKITGTGITLAQLQAATFTLSGTLRNKVINNYPNVPFDVLCDASRIEGDVIITATEVFISIPIAWAGAVNMAEGQVNIKIDGIQTGWTVVINTVDHPVNSDVMYKLALRTVVNETAALSSEGTIFVLADKSYLSQVMITQQGKTTVYENIEARVLDIDSADGQVNSGASGMTPDGYTKYLIPCANVSEIKVTGTTSATYGVIQFDSIN